MNSPDQHSQNSSRFIIPYEKFQITFATLQTYDFPSSGFPFGMKNKVMWGYPVIGQFTKIWEETFQACMLVNYQFYPVACPHGGSLRENGLKIIIKVLWSWF